MRKMIQVYPELELSRTKSYISIIGNEISKRKLYKNLLASETNGNFTNLTRLNEMFEEFDLIRIKDILLQVFDKYNFNVREMSFPILMLHIGISIGRMLRRNYVQFEMKNEFKETKEYRIACDFYHEVKKEIPIYYIEDEIFQLTNLLIGKNCISVSLNDVPVDVVQLVDDVIKDVNDTFHVNFVDDEDLKVGLQMHIISLLNRIEHTTIIENILLSDIKKNYPMVFEISVYISNFISKKLNIKISENEIGFFALHIGAAYDRENMNKKYKAVLILPVGKSLANLCYSKLKSKFEGRLQIVSVLNYYEEDKINELNPDIILTSTNFKHKSLIPVFQISVFLNAADEVEIINALNELDKSRINFEFVTRIIHIINPAFFYNCLDVKTPEEVIEILSDRMIEEGIVAEGFKQRVLQREKLSSSSFVYSFATPHAFGIEIYKSTISVALLKEPIMWGNFKVKLVFLLAVNEKDMEILNLFFEWLSYTINHPDKFLRLLEVKDYDEFILKILS